MSIKACKTGLFSVESRMTGVLVAVGKTVDEGWMVGVELLADPAVPVIGCINCNPGTDPPE